MIETTLSLFIGTDQVFRIHVLNSEAAAVRVRDHQAPFPEDAAIDLSGWTLGYMLKRRLTDTDAQALLALRSDDVSPSIAVSGAFDADPETNAQRALVTLTDTQTDALTAGVAFWEIKRLDDGYEAILATGRQNVKRAVHVS